MPLHSTHAVATMEDVRVKLHGIRGMTMTTTRLDHEILMFWLSIHEHTNLSLRVFGHDLGPEIKASEYSTRTLVNWRGQKHAIAPLTLIRPKLCFDGGQNRLKQ